ncbi:MAG: CooT family nickel-binding protein [Deltaproteobacteria bacterium]|nr:CooT family nickel-binding protein [Deltaproteobacteria bacterium]
MCEVNVYITHDGREELFLSAVDTVMPEDDNSWRLTSIFGEQKLLHGKIRSMHLVDHRIVFERSESAQTPATTNTEAQG